MKKFAAVLLLAGVFSIGLGVAYPSFATDWKYHEAKRIEEQQKRRAKELEKAKTAKEAEDKARRMYYEEQCKKDLERKIRYEEQRRRKN